MTEISDLKRRVEAVGERFGRLAEQEDSYGERLAGLLKAVEDGFARNQREVQKLESELESAQDEVKKLSGELEDAKRESRRHGSELNKLREERDKLSGEMDGAKEESRQLRGMLLTLLEAVEGGGSLDLGAAMRKLESRIDRIVTSTDSSLAAEPDFTPTIGDAIESLSAAAPAESLSEVADEPAFEASDDVTPIPVAVPAASEAMAADEDKAAPEAIVAHAEEPAPPAKPKDPPKLKAAEVAARKAAEPPSDDDLSAVNKIIQRISLLTGEFVEPSQKHAASAGDKAIPALKVGNGSDEAGADKSSSGDESTAKSS